MAKKRPYRNAILSSLADDALWLLEDDLEGVSLPSNDVIAHADAAVDHVYFLESGIAAVTIVASPARRTLVGLQGRDGMGPVPVLLGMPRAPQQTAMLVPGEGYRIATGALLIAIGASDPLRQLMLVYAHLFSLQAAFCALSNAIDAIDVRLARQLLMIHDRVDGDRIAVTHEALSVLLAVRRASITTAVHVLEGHRLITNERGEIAIRDRPALQRYARDAYGGPEGEHRRALGPFEPDRQ